MRFRRPKLTLPHIAVAMMIIAILLMSLNMGVRHAVVERNINELRNVTLELAKLVNLTWQKPVAQLQARRALVHALAILKEYHGETPHSLLHIARTAATGQQKKVPLDVCPEKFLGTKADYPWFEKGRVVTNCTNAQRFPTVISILLNGFDYVNESQIVVVLRDIYDRYPHLTVHLAVAEKIVIPDGVKLGVLQHIIGKNQAANDVWNWLVTNATTDYVLVARRIERFQWYALLERMVRVVSELGVDAVGGALRTPDGHWSMGCQQTLLQNYTLTYTAGYHLSTHSCTYCDYIPSPFVGRTSTLRDVKFKMASPDTVFHGYFLRLQRDQKLVMVCPDAMFHVLANNETASSLHQQWIPMVQTYGINHVNFADGRHMSFSCSEALTNFSSTDGIIAPVCTIEALLKGIHDVMDICQKIGLFCQLDGAVALGALKFNGILPWAREANISFAASRNVTFWDSRGEFAKLGYTLSLGQSPKFGTKKVRRPRYILAIPYWRIQLFGCNPRLMSGLQREPGMASTMLLLGGRWVNASSNPALTSRYRYGALGYLRHPETNVKCPKPESHVCLDQYPADGNTDFIYQ